MDTTRLHRRKREAWPVLAGVVSASTYDRAETYRHSHSPTPLVPVVEDGPGLQPPVAAGDGVTGHRGQSLAERLSFLANRWEV